MTSPRRTPQKAGKGSAWGRGPIPSEATTSCEQHALDPPTVPQEPLGLLEAKPKGRTAPVPTLSNDGGRLPAAQTGPPDGRLADVRPVNHLVHAVEGQPDDDFILQVQTG